MDLYNRLDELIGMTHLLIDDVNLLKPGVGALAPNPSQAQEANRRFYIRAVFALVEAFVEQHRRLLLDLVDVQKITLDETTITKLQEIRIIPHPDGRIEQRTQYLRTFEKIRTVYTAAGVGFNEPLNISFEDQQWESFQEAMRIRNGITHPKNVQDCWISEHHLQTVDEAHEWFKTLPNEFVRVARAHRAAHHW